MTVVVAAYLQIQDALGCHLESTNERLPVAVQPQMNSDSCWEVGHMLVAGHVVLQAASTLVISGPHAASLLEDCTAFPEESLQVGVASRAPSASGHSP